MKMIVGKKLNNAKRKYISKVKMYRLTRIFGMI